jgi:hypothetical protein
LFGAILTYVFFRLLIHVELALLNDAPRVATVKAKGRLKCATLGKRAFVRLLGPVVDIIKRNSANYQTIEQQIQQQQAAQAAQGTSSPQLAASSPITNSDANHY